MKKSGAGDYQDSTEAGTRKTPGGRAGMGHHIRPTRGRNVGSRNGSRIKKEYPQLKLAVITPFLNQEEKWKEETQDYYRNIVRQADYINSVYQTPYQGVWQLQEKDKFLLSHSDGLLLVYDEENEGSPKFLSKLAAKKADQGDYQFFALTPTTCRASQRNSSDNYTMTISKRPRAGAGHPRLPQAAGAAD